MHTLYNKPFLRYLLLFCLITFSKTHCLAADEIDIHDVVKNGNVVALMRHALAPGNGDPAEFSLSDCKTQRNLSDEGRQQAQQIGLALKKAGVMRADVYSSQWCRCIDTATNLDLGPVHALPFLNSFYQDRSTENLQTEQLKNWIFSRLAPANSNTKVLEQKKILAILVTHQVNITALTGVFPASGELVFVTMENDKLAVVTNAVVPFQDQ